MGNINASGLEAPIDTKKKRIGIIGAGIFGCSVAIETADAGYDVELIDRLDDIMLGTSRNNTNRVHMGFHYPRDLATARACRDDYQRFCTTYAPAVVDDFPNHYAIATEGSRTTAEDYLAFCRLLEAPYELLDPADRSVGLENCSLLLKCPEAVCDSDILRHLLITELRSRPNVSVRCGVDVTSIVRRDGRYVLGSATETTEYDAVVNCGYADINRLGSQLGLVTSSYQFEYTFVPIIEVDLSVRGITVMDGPFMTLLPHGKSGHYSLYHVEHSVIDRQVGTMMSEGWLHRPRRDGMTFDHAGVFERMRLASQHFVPALRGARLIGWLEGPRMILANHDNDDARPSVLQDHGLGFMSVFSGKIDRCLTIADRVVEALHTYFVEEQRESGVATA